MQINCGVIMCSSRDGEKREIYIRARENKRRRERERDREIAAYALNLCIQKYI